MLWAGLHFASLSLDVFTRGWSAAQAECRFVVASGGNAPHVVAANDAARVAGIRRGLSITAALALAPDIVLRDRDVAAEAHALEQIATSLLRFTPQVSIARTDALALEIGGSLRLFGGLQHLTRQIDEAIRAQGYCAQLAIAPTPTAALLLARSDLPSSVLGTRQLAAALASLPLKLLDIDAEALAMLSSAGVTTFGQVAELPRDALARRCGAALVTTIDRALARLPDPRTAYRPPPRFVGRVELPVPIDDIEALAFGVNRLVHDLSHWLTVRGLGVVKMTIELTHEHYLRQRGVSPTRVPFALGAPARAPAHLLGVLRERLVRVALPAPVEAIVLESDETAPLGGRNLGLLPGDEADAVQVPLVDRLRARLGDDAVVQLTPLAEHRPEKSDRARTARLETREASRSKKSCHDSPLPEAPRPLWLFDEVEPLRHRFEHAPWVLKDGPERIESGWWDGNDLRRDYFVAETPDGAVAWIYRDHRYGTDEGEWFVHGLFA